MPVIHKKGDLLESGAQVIFHGCNCFCIMKRGIAPQIANKYPKAWKADQNTVKGSKTKLGKCTWAWDGSTMVFNLYTQYRPGPDLSYWALEMALNEMKLILYDLPDDHVIAGPRIGCGLAGGDWNRVEAIINLVFPKRDIHIYTL